MESLVRLPDGRFLAIAEDAPGPATGRPGDKDVLLFPGDPMTPAGRYPVRLSYQPPEGYLPTDALWLGGAGGRGQMLVLNRRAAPLTLFTGVVTLVDVGAPRARQRLVGRVVPRLEAPLQHDNYEAMTLSWEKGGAGAVDRVGRQPSVLRTEPAPQIRDSTGVGGLTAIRSVTTPSGIAARLDLSPQDADRPAMVAPPASSLLPPFGAACLGIAIFSGMDAVMKHLSIVLGAYNAMLWRTTLSLVLLVPVFLIRGGRVPPRAVLGLHICRGLVMGCSLILFFWALARVPMALGIGLSFISPLIGLALAALFLKEKVGRGAVGASLVAFMGVLVILAGQPRGSAAIGDWRAPAAILLAAFLYAIGTVLSRPLAQRAAPLEIALFFNLVAGGLYLAGAPWFAAWPPPVHVPALAMASLTATISVMLVAWAYARAEAQYLLPVEYTAFLWAVLFGWLVFAETVTLATLAGAALIMGACLWTARGGSPAAPHPEPAPDAHPG